MTKNLCYIIPLIGLAAVAPSLLAQEPPKGPPQVERQMRVIVGSDDGAPNNPHKMKRVFVHGGKAEMETVTFLGVETAPVGPTLAAQLNLAPGAGLVVGHIVPDSPAAAALKTHDVLVKLDDQMLIEPHQFSVLVRNHKEGDEVSLTLVRGGKETVVKVKLGRHDVPKFAAAGGDAFHLNLPLGGEDQSLPGSDRVEMDRVLSLMDGGAMPGLRRMHITHGNGIGDRTVSVTVNTGDSNLNFSDEKGSFELKIDDGKKSLVAKNPKGDVVFSGPVNTPEERKNMPAEVRERLEKIESMNEFSFKTDSDFKPGEVKVVHPPGTKILYQQHLPPGHLPPPPVF